MSVCHADPPDPRGHVAPCGATLLPTVPHAAGEAWSSSPRWINCPGCLALRRAARKEASKRFGVARARR